MPNANYLKGRRFEWEVAKHYRGLGYDASRMAGSHGKFDLVVVSPVNGSVNFIQCKTTEDEATGRRLIAKFRETPPYQPYTLPNNVHQIMLVKVKGSSIWLEGSL